MIATRAGFIKFAKEYIAAALARHEFFPTEEAIEQAAIAVADGVYPAPEALPPLAPGPRSFDYLKIGDRVSRHIGGQHFMNLSVTGYGNHPKHGPLIICSEWEFHVATGLEVDDVLGWGPQGSGSYLVHADEEG